MKSNAQTADTPRQPGVPLDYIQAVQATGLQALTFADLATMYELGITAENVRELQQRNGPYLSGRRLIEMYRVSSRSANSKSD